MAYPYFGGTRRTRQYLGNSKNNSWKWRQKPSTQFLIGENEWVEGWKWYDAISARKMEQLRKSRLNCWIKDIGRSKHMLDTRYYEGYEGEGEVKVWSEENGNEDGIVIWIGFLIQF